jgi:hypothetical protein
VRFLILILVLVPALVHGAPRAVSTFHSLGLYWTPQGASESNAARVEFRRSGTSDWRKGLDLWFDERNGEYRGSLVELEPGTTYEVKLTLANGAAETIRTATWSEAFPVKRTVQVQPGKRLVIRPEDSGDEKGYVVFTAPPGRNVIHSEEESCVLVKQGAHHVIIRGLVLRDCTRYGVLLQRGEGAQTHDVVVEANEIVGWGAFGIKKPGIADSDAAIHCDYYRESDDAKRPDRIIIQGNRIHDPRHGANPWRSSKHGRLHPYGPLGVMFNRCGRNHVIRYNDIVSANGNHYKDGLGGAENFSDAGFPWADSDIYGNRIANVYDDAIEAEGGNRNVRIWNNHFDRVFVAIANAAVTTGPLYVWRNVSERQSGMNDPEGLARRAQRGQFIKAGSRDPSANGGRAYYFHNTALDAGYGIHRIGRVYNFVSRNNVWRKPYLKAEDGPFDAASDFEPPLSAKGNAARIPNFNDRYPRPDAGAQQSGVPPMRFGAEWINPRERPLHAAPT